MTQWLSFSDPVQQLIDLTSISRLSRQIALEDPTLWTEINWRLPAWAINTFPRSGFCGLEVVIREHEGGSILSSTSALEKTPALFEEITTEHASRIRELIIHASSRETLDVIMANFSTSNLSSMLTTLFLRLKPRRWKYRPLVALLQSNRCWRKQLAPHQGTARSQPSSTFPYRVILGKRNAPARYNLRALLATHRAVQDIICSCHAIPAAAVT